MENYSFKEYYCILRRLPTLLLLLRHSGCCLVLRVSQNVKRETPLSETETQIEDLRSNLPDSHSFLVIRMRKQISSGLSMSIVGGILVSLQINYQHLTGDAGPDLLLPLCYQVQFIKIRAPLVVLLIHLLLLFCHPVFQRKKSRGRWNDSSSLSL